MIIIHHILPSFFCLCTLHSDMEFGCLGEIMDASVESFRAGV